MPAFKLEQFGGMLPAWDDRLLPAGQGALAVNTYLFSGALTGWRAPKKLRDLTNPNAKMAYRVPTVVEARAGAYLFFNSNPNAGDTVLLGEETYLFTATVTNAYDVLLGATAADSAQNLLDAFLVTDGKSGTIYGNGTCPNPAISDLATDIFIVGSPLYIRVVAPDIGAAFNTTKIAESTGGTRLNWATTAANVDSTLFFVGGLNSTFDSAITGSAIWLEFTDPDTDVLKSPIVDDRFNRYYFASPSLPPKYNTYDRIKNSQHEWLLGVPAPGCSPGVAVEGGSDQAQLGNVTSTNPVAYTINANKITLIKIRPIGAMQLDSLSFMPSGDNANAEYAAVVYDDNGGKPGELMNIGTIVSGVTNATEANSAFINPSGLTADTDYWVGFMVDEDVVFTKANTETDAVVFDNTFSNGPPQFAPIPPTLVTGSPDLQIWANLTTDNVLEARAYVYTWVTEYDEEGPPSPPTTITGWGNGTWTITLFTPPPDEMGVTRNITKLKLYRTIAAVGGQATFFLVDTVPIGTGTYVDTKGDDDVALNAQLESTDWFPPPEGLVGFKAMPNGFFVGWKDNELWFSEPYRPHAWPPKYVQTTEFPVVGVAVAGQGVGAATSSNPYFGQGVNPASISMTKLNLVEPCVSRAGVIGNDQGIHYYSPNGLIQISPTGAITNITETWITREKWRQFTPTKNLRAIFLIGCYFAFGTTNGADVDVAKQGFFIELAALDAQSFTIWPQPGGHRIGFNQLTSPNGFNIDNVLVDPWTGIGMLLQNNGIYYYDFSDTAPTIVPFKWRSKKYQQTSKKNFEVMKIYFDIPPNSPTLNATRMENDTDDPVWNTLAADRYGIVRVYADDALVTTREIRKSAEVLRILSGFKADTWQWEFEGRVAITNMQGATSVKELGSV